MPFKSKAQERAAFSGALGPEMKSRAKLWASETDQKSLPDRVKPKGGRKAKPDPKPSAKKRARKRR